MTPAQRPIDPTGIPSVDGLADIQQITLSDYVRAVSEYVRTHRNLLDGPKKAAQIRLSAGLATALVSELRARLPQMRNVRAGETDVSGALRIARADVSEMDSLDGLRLAIEIKPVNLAVGRAIWNRFGDIRTFAVNLHLKFPFAVVGGVLVIPTYEEKRQRDGTYVHISTRHLIERAVKRLTRAGGRRSEADAPHLLEAVTVIAYDPDTASLDPDLPYVGSGLRWDEFINDLVQAYDSRFMSEAPRTDTSTEADFASDGEVLE